MDPVTHLASGVLVGQAVRDRIFPGRAVVWFAVTAAWLPDADNLATLLGPEAYMRLHRGLSHSLVGGAVAALVLALAMRWFRKDYPLGKLFILAYGCMLLHDALDVLTSYGTQLLQPFSDARISFPVLYIVDPFLTGAMLICCLFTLRRAWRERAALAGLALLCVFPLTNWGVRQYVARSFETAWSRAGLGPATIEVLPEAFAPLAWKVVADDGQTLRAAGVDVLRPTRRGPFLSGRKADLDQLRRLGEQAPILKTYAWFFRFPVVEERVKGDGLALVWKDLRFAALSPYLGDSWRVGPPPFSVEADLDATGALTAWRILRRGAGGGERVAGEGLRRPKG